VALLLLHAAFQHRTMLAFLLQALGGLTQSFVQHGT